MSLCRTSRENIALSLLYFVAWDGASYSRGDKFYLLIGFAREKKSIVFDKAQ